MRKWNLCFFIDWPAQSPNLNPIEYLWAYLKRKLVEYEKVAGGGNELWDRIAVEREAIGDEICYKLVESMPEHVEAVYKAKGG